jgi:hypothetical protein
VDFNLIDKLNGIEKLTNITVLYMRLTLRPAFLMLVWLNLASHSDVCILVQQQLDREVDRVRQVQGDHQA